MLYCVNAYSSYEDALKLYQAKDFKKSLKMLADELVTADDFKQGSKNYEIRYLAAHNHWKLGNNQSVIDHMKRCIEIRKNSIEPYIDLSLFFIEIKRLGDAEKTAENGLKISKSAMLYYVIGKCALLKKDYWRAKGLFEKANSLDPELYMSYNDLGITLMNIHKYSEANAAFSVALATKTRSPEILNNIGLSLEKLGKKAEAAEYYKKALSLDLNNSTIAKNLERIKK
jgi:tetratricopeptide (TPR) repeat protein